MQRTDRILEHIVGSVRISLMADLDALTNRAAIGTGVSIFVWAFILTMLMDIALFFHEIFTGWCVPFLGLEPAL
jgi:hypothetical protein